MQAALVAQYHRQDGAWWTDVDCRLQVDGGQLDVVYFDVPLPWGELIQADSSLSWHWIELPQSNRRRLAVWPRRPLEGQCQLRISGPSPPTAAEGMRLPDIAPLNIDIQQWLVIVPTLIDGQPITWETQQLTSASLPTETTLTDSVAPRAFRVTGRDFRAVARHPQITPGTPTIRQADIRFTMLADHHFHAVAAYHLEPAGSSHVTCQLPNNCQLLQLRVADLPAPATRQGDGQWRIALGSDALPQRIDVVYAGRIALTPTAPTRLPAPLDPACCRWPEPLDDHGGYRHPAHVVGCRGHRAGC